MFSPSHTQPSERSAANEQSLPICIAGVTKTYGPVNALKNVSLDIQSGEFMTLLGPSGSGKTTLLMTLAGFIRPDHGSIKFGEEEMSFTPPHKRGVGMMFQNYALFPHMNVFANIAYPLKIAKRSKSEIKDAVDEVLETVQLPGYQSRRISELSGGQRQRIALARAIVFKPKILLMDEPLSALDKNLREAMQVELRSMHERLGMTTVLVTHDQREALTMSDRVAVLRGGQIAQLDTASQIYNSPTSAFVAAFMGESNFLKVAVAGSKCSYRGKELKVASNAVTDGAGLLVIRPEKLEIVASPDGHDAFNIFDGVLERTLFQGESYLAFIRLPDGNLLNVRQHLNQASRAAIPQPGSQVTLSLHESETVVVADDVER
ncbi:ABC transporter ATP-binding protein [Rhizobium rhizogenes]|uniref:Spermidine/putrescine import ATP-binding protein PotA n=1 Tax=Agrobacterium tumefaciens TaxID=358 RepID=K7WT21_AGRTU|nr:ABC transporter ATP-binding protein [Rhizobium rhizogenes]AFX65622.1 ABC transporter of mannopine, nucleotide binding/ATPase protein [Agrobacterium radiobacter]NTI39013.1 ABC transporter ATP-binding protein [Rhizobium rhizogenes]NTI85197.1 ABC transporter ATP-binding protein [Rhizobium rhizogenes]NTJ27383.1 ABC transporter ATP-binding protein [Rhizobium rhizogenes]QUE84806.1 ABC transporter ATP-binding protein [Rhizobium rhizogenes]